MPQDKLFHRMLVTGLLAGAALLGGCELSQNIPLPQATPTQNVEQVQTPTVAPTGTLEATLTPSMTVSSAPQVESSTPAPPTETPTTTPTFNPYATYIMQQDDTMYYILQQPPFNYQSDSWNAIINQILELNPFIRSADRLPGPGSSIIIPLPSWTPTPEGFVQTQAAQPNAPVQDPLLNAQIIQVTVQEGQTIIGIAQSNSTTLPIIATLNPQISFFGCDFSNPSGGPGCNVSLSVGDPVNVPALTPTPTLSPTISGSETPTPTPTFRAPSLAFPPQDANAPARTFSLQWVTAGVLNQGEVYLVEIEDQTAATQHADVTTGTSYELRDEWVPSDGQVHNMRWRVSVAAQNDQGVYRYIGATGDWRSFRWQSR